MQHCMASPQQFCLRWNNYQSNLTNVFDQLLQSESFVDVTLACDGHSVKAHKMVLSACSPYFQSLFFDNPCQHPIVILKDIKWPELKAVVEFMYKGEINVSQEQIGPLLKVAESLKIRGLADVNGEPEPGSTGENKKNWEARPGPTPHDLSENAISPATTPQQQNQQQSQQQQQNQQQSQQQQQQNQQQSQQQQQNQQQQNQQQLLHRQKKRRRTSGERSSISSPEESLGAEGLDTSGLELSPQPPPNTMVNSQGLPPPPPPQNHPHGPTLVPIPGDPGLPLPPPPHPDDMEIKPGIAEMIREEERAKLLESSHAWLGASTSSLAADSYQYQLQSMWQKCWNTNQSLVHNLRFRERGPLKSWRPETMAEAIFSVLKEGLSLSQAARKYDIPYPTFVLYANRVHNMLGPSADGGADLRPKGRGRPQRILLGSWPEDHIRGVIRAVVFRDTQHIKEEPHLGYPRLQEPLGVQNYPSGSCSNGPEPTVSPGAAAAAAVAVVAQGLRQQMCSMVAAAQHNASLSGDAGVGLVNSLGGLVGHCNSLGLPSNGTTHGGMPGLGLASPLGSGLRVASPVGSELRAGSPAESAAASPVPSPLGGGSSAPTPTPTPTTPSGGGPLSNVEVGIGVSGMTYKPTTTFTSPRPENLFQEDIEDIVKSPQLGSPDSLVKEPKETITVKVEPIIGSPHE